MTISGHMLRMACAKPVVYNPIVARYGAGEARIIFPTIPTNGYWDWGDGSERILNPAGVQTKVLTNPSVAEFHGTINGGVVRLAGTVTHIDEWIEGPSNYQMWAASMLVAVPDWLPSSVTSMFSMFRDASAFNQDISGWDVSNITTMSRGFQGAAAFNQNIGNWDVSNVSDMSWLFGLAAAFNQDLSAWCVSSIPTMPGNFDTSTPAWNKTNRQPIWGTCP